MNLLNFLVMVVFLVILSIVDLKTFNKEKGGIPAFLTTAFMILMLVLSGTGGLYYGVLAGLLSLFFVDIGLFKGIPDIKIFIGIGLTFHSLFPFLIFAITMLICGMIMQTSILTFTKVDKEKGEMPYIPVMFLSYLIAVGVMLI